MTITDIESAVRKQLPFDPYKFDTARVQEEFNNLSAPTIVCGLINIYIANAEKAVTAYYDMPLASYRKSIALFNTQLSRVAEIVGLYRATDYRNFTEKFKERHPGMRLSHILGSRRQFSIFLANDNFCFLESDFNAFFIHTKSQLAKNYLSLLSPHPEKYVDVSDLGF